MSMQTQLAAGLARLVQACNVLAGRVQPAGGALGQVLTKTAAANYASAWQTPAGGGGGAPAGPPSSVQFSNMGVMDGAANVDIIGGDLNLGLSTPGASPANTLTLFPQTIGGRMMLAMIGPSGLAAGLQPFLARNKVGVWQPQGNAATVPGVFGYTAPTVTGTLTARNVATTNFFTRLRRIGCVSVATAPGFSELRVGVAQVALGNGTGLGGFTKVLRFGISDAAAVAGARMFAGVSSSTAGAANVEPATLTNSIGMGHGAADTTFKIYYGGSAAQAPIDLGANFPCNTRSVDAYELALFASPFLTDSVGYMVTRLNTGQVASGLLTAATAGLQLPLAATLLSYQKIWRTNNATALAVALDVAGDYIETDN